MPLLAVTDAGAFIPPQFNVNQLILTNEGPDDARFGWEPVITNNGTVGTDGALLKVGATLAFAGRDVDLAGKLQFITAATDTATISYTQRS